MKLQRGIQTAVQGCTKCMYSFVQLGPNSSHKIQIKQLCMYSVVVQLSPNACNFRESYSWINWHNLRQHNENRCYYHIKQFHNKQWLYHLFVLLKEWSYLTPGDRIWFYFIVSCCGRKQPYHKQLSTFFFFFLFSASESVQLFFNLKLNYVFPCYLNYFYCFR